jgi:hypothetical protein
MSNSDNKINIGNSWKSLDSMQINIEDTWKDVKEAYVNIGDSWKQFYTTDIVEMVTDGLVLYLDSGKIESYPGTGTTWHDLSGSNNDGTLIGPPTYSSDNGGVLVFDGVNDYISTGNSFMTELDTGNVSYTLEAWVYIASAPGVTYSGYCIIGNAAGTGVGLQLMESSGTKANFGYHSTSNFYSISNLSLNTWHHIVGTRQSGVNNYLYIDGQLDVVYSPSSLTIATTTEEIQIGWSNGRHTENKFDGKIAIAKIYDTYLTYEQVQQNYNASCERFGLNRINPIDIIGIVTNKLSLYLDAANTNSYSGTGTVWHDLSGYNRDVFMDTSLSPVYNNDSFYFNLGANFEASNISLPLTTEFTMEVWYRQTGPGVGSPRLIETNIFESVGSASSHCLTVDANGSLRTWWDSADTAYSRFLTLDDATLYPFNQWRYIASTYSSPNGVFYVNGISVKTGSVATTNLDDVHTITIGAISDLIDYTHPGHYFTGDIAIVSVYNKALSQAEITQNFNALRGRFGI